METQVYSDMAVAAAVNLFHHDSDDAMAGSVAEWLACLTQAQKGSGSNRSRDAVG